MRSLRCPLYFLKIVEQTIQSSDKKKKLEHTECCGRASQLKCACEHCTHLRNAEKRVLCGVPCIESKLPASDKAATCYIQKSKTIFFKKKAPVKEWHQPKKKKRSLLQKPTTNQKPCGSDKRIFLNINRTHYKNTFILRSRHPPTHLT